MMRLVQGFCHRSGKAPFCAHTNRFRYQDLGAGRTITVGEADSEDQGQPDVRLSAGGLPLHTVVVMLAAAFGVLMGRLTFLADRSPCSRPSSRAWWPLEAAARCNSAR
jgi:hypothetical protein